MFQLVTQHRLNACDISHETSTSTCDKVRLIQVWRQNHVLYHILNIAPPDNFHSLWRYIMTLHLFIIDLFGRKLIPSFFKEQSFKNQADVQIFLKSNHCETNLLNSIWHGHPSPPPPPPPKKKKMLWTTVLKRSGERSGNFSFLIVVYGE